MAADGHRREQPPTRGLTPNHPSHQDPTGDTRGDHPARPGTPTRPHSAKTPDHRTKTITEGVAVDPGLAKQLQGSARPPGWSRRPSRAGCAPRRLGTGREVRSRRGPRVAGCPPPSRHLRCSTTRRSAPGPSGRNDSCAAAAAFMKPVLRTSAPSPSGMTKRVHTTSAPASRANHIDLPVQGEHCRGPPRRCVHGPNVEMSRVSDHQPRYSRSSRRRILPLAVLGSSSTKKIARGYL